MLDMMLLGRKDVDRDRLVHLRALAFVEYRMLYEHSQPSRDGIKWKGRDDRKVDLYCVFCGDLIVTFPKPWWQRASEPEIWNPVQDHVSICALQCLSGIRKPPPPGTCNVPTQQMALAEVAPLGDGPLFGAKP